MRKGSRGVSERLWSARDTWRLVQWQRALRETSAGPQRSVFFSGAVTLAVPEGPEPYEGHLRPALPLATCRRLVATPVLQRCTEPGPPVGMGQDNKCHDVAFAVTASMHRPFGLMTFSHQNGSEKGDRRPSAGPWAAGCVSGGASEVGRRWGLGSSGGGRQGSGGPRVEDLGGLGATTVGSGSKRTARPEARLCVVG